MPRMTALPANFLNSLSHCPLPDPEGFERVHEEGDALVSLRLNPFKPARPAFEWDGSIPWCRQGYYLKSRPNFTHDPLFQSGAYYVQEAGSMFLEEALRQHLDMNASLKVLDLCAAPGGKSTHLASLISRQSLLVSNEVHQARSQVLAYNLSKWGCSNLAVTNAPVEQFGELRSYFDLMVVDAPCSGSGLFRKQPDAVQEWSLPHVASCAQRQKKILESALPALKAGAHLFYSTCSYSREENEEIVDWLCAEKGLKLLNVEVSADWNLVSEGKGWRFYPHRTRTEGFFCALLRKESEEPPKRSAKTGQETEKASAAESQALNAFFSCDDRGILKHKGRFYLLSDGVREFLLREGKGLYFRKAGCQMGGFKGGELVPDHELALSADLSPEIPRLELEAGEALRYLKKESLPGNFGRSGWVLATHQGHGIGWGKLLGNRMNNYLPAQWRVLK